MRERKKGFLWIKYPLSLILKGVVVTEQERKSWLGSMNWTQYRKKREKVKNASVILSLKNIAYIVSKKKRANNVDHIVLYGNHIPAFQRFMACLGVLKRRGSRVKGGKVI